jgi:hypothetical protein
MERGQVGIVAAGDRDRDVQVAAQPGVALLAEAASVALPRLGAAGMDARIGGGRSANGIGRASGSEHTMPLTMSGRSL